MSHIRRCEEITDPDEKLRCLYVLSEHLVPDRWDHVRPANKSEVFFLFFWSLLGGLIFGLTFFL